MKTKYITSIALSMLLFGCSDNTDKNNTSNNVTQITQPAKVSADMSVGTITIDGKQVNLSDIPVPAVQPKQFTITPKLLYTLAYEASGGNELLVSYSISKAAIDNDAVLTDIKLKSGIKNLQYKLIPFTIKTLFKGINQDEAMYRVAIQPNDIKEAITIANILISMNQASVLKIGLSQTSMDKYIPQQTDEEFQAELEGRYVPRLTISTENLFTSKFQYTNIIDRLNDCSKQMETIEGVLACYSDKDDNPYNERYTTDDMISIEMDLGMNETPSDKVFQVIKQKNIQNLKNLEKSGQLKDRYNSFQTTYKKLFGSEYIK